MAKHIETVHHADRRNDVVMPYAPGTRARRPPRWPGVTAAPSPQPPAPRRGVRSPRDHARASRPLTMENLKKTIEAAGGFGDLVFSRAISPTSRNRTTSIACGAPTWQGSFSPPRPRSRCRAWPPMRAASRISAIAVVAARRSPASPRSPGPPRGGLPEGDGVARLRRSRGHGGPHGQAPPGRGPLGGRLQPHGQQGSLARRRGAAAGRLAARGGLGGRHRVHHGDRSRCARGGERRRQRTSGGPAP